jgi:hypothetical protein
MATNPYVNPVGQGRGYYPPASPNRKPVQQPKARPTNQGDNKQMPIGSSTGYYQPAARQPVQQPKARPTNQGDNKQMPIGSSTGYYQPAAQSNQASREPKAFSGKKGRPASTYPNEPSEFMEAADSFDLSGVDTSGLGGPSAKDSGNSFLEAVGGFDLSGVDTSELERRNAPTIPDTPPEVEEAPPKAIVVPEEDDDQLQKLFRVAHGGPFNPKSKMDKGKMEQIRGMLAEQGGMGDMTPNQFALQLYRKHYAADMAKKAKRR